jgi:hypothetical protein
MFQDISAKALAFQHAQPPPRSPLEEIRELIARYPNLGEIELAQLIDRYRHLCRRSTWR